MTSASVTAGDCRRLVVSEPCVVITDSPWPGADVVPGSKDVPALLRAVLDPLVGVARRVVLVLGCLTDVRVLAAVPSAWPYVRTCWLRHTVPFYCGTLLGSANVAYVFGDASATRPHRVLPGECSQNRSVSLRDEGGGWHPCPMRLDHALWLVNHFSAPDELIVDPFAGAATIGVAAMRLGRRYHGTEIVPEWASRAQERIDAEARHSSLYLEDCGQQALWRCGSPKSAIGDLRRVP